ncbi:MAG: hypothetical protein OEW75_12990 [Cyclobacteriaceae bacterium]|nr:hypothetical protein [Cyclobacteriaceae bacterium]
MIIYGIGNKRLKESEIEMECNACGHTSTKIGIYQRYFHLFWIPTIPVGKRILLTCPKCQREREGKQLPEGIQTKSGSLKSSVKTPPYIFSGLAIVVLVIGFVFFNSHRNSEQTKSYFDKPAVNDVYAMYDPQETTEFKYYFMKVSEISEDSIYFLPNEFGYNRIPDELDVKDGFYPIIYSFDKQELQELFTEGDIKEIYREYSENSGFNRVLEFDESWFEDVMDTTEVILQ